MAVLNQFKNFIRHGKAAREGSGVSTNESGASSRAESATNHPAGAATSNQATSSSAQNYDSNMTGPQVVEAKGAPATAQTSYEPAASTTRNNASSQAQPSNVVASAIPGHVKGSSVLDQYQTPEPSLPAHSSYLTPADQNGGNSGPTTPLISNEAQQFTKEAERIVEEERIASEKMPHYAGLNERFQLISKMGDGAFSNVYKARYRKTGQKVAIKVVRKYELNSNQNDGRLDPQFRKKNRVTERANILKEVQIMRNLRHDGIVKLLEFSESRDHYFLVLELLEGGELFHQIVKLTYFSEALARHVILQVAHGIRYLHEERGIVHRDIKPENLLFESIKIIPSKVDKARPYDEEKEDEGEFMPGIGGGGIGRVKIADFGLSKVVWEESTMTPCGTVGYTAPEIVKDERYSKSVDMWALGCVLYTLLCGFPPFYDESISVLTEKVAKGYYTFLSPWWDDISSSSKDLITHLLCVETEKRYTIDEFLAHPWCNVKDPIPNLDSADIALAKASEMPLDSPMLQSMKKGGAARQAMMSPGINQLKEAFDVTYAVHRMEEEGSRRRGAAGQENLRGMALNEDDEEESTEQDRQEVRNAAQRKGEQVPAALDSHRHEQQQQQQQQPQQQQYQGRGGADRKLAEAALYEGRAGTRDRGSASRNKRNFELNMGNATLLGRRNKVGAPITPGAPGTPGSISQILGQGSHPTQIAPGSPMRVD